MDGRGWFLCISAAFRCGESSKRGASWSTRSPFLSGHKKNRARERGLSEGCQSDSEGCEPLKSQCRSSDSGSVSVTNLRTPY